MASKGQDSGDGLDQSDSGDGDVQFIEAPKADQPRFLTPVRDAQMRPASPAIPSWLSSSIIKKRSLQPVSMPVKDIVTRYAARGSKAKKMKIDAQLIKYPLCVACGKGALLFLSPCMSQATNPSSLINAPAQNRRLVASQKLTLLRIKLERILQFLPNFRAKETKGRSSISILGVINHHHFYLILQSQS